MKGLAGKGKTIFLLFGLLVLVGFFFYFMMRSGPLAPVEVTATVVEFRSLTPALFGIGTVNSQASYRIGPTIPGRVKELSVRVGDLVEKGQVLGAMDPVDWEQRLAAQDSVVRRLEASLQAGEARIAEVAARRTYASAQAKRYDNLLMVGAVSLDAAQAKRQEAQAIAALENSARAERDAIRADLARAREDRKGLVKQKDNLLLISPSKGLVTARNIEPGTTVVAGQAVVEVIDRENLWISVRFDQAMASGLTPGLSASIALRSQRDTLFPGRVLRVEPLADAVTEELLAKAVFDTVPDVLPPLGELAEVTVTLPPLPETTVVPVGSLQRLNGDLGVWILDNGSITFRPVKTGRSDLEGFVQVMSGLEKGENIAHYMKKALSPRSRVKVVESLEAKE
ncbi:MAG TPA: efflux transporter periplasmic adaptor subunit [Deltaproteobacteria bacterium]|nr:efflux transporter periplasmic adaptor subunit [Deltaproteobacteria bacterium]